MKHHDKSKQLGFSLIELLLVISLLGILAATALPKFFSGMDVKARENVRSTVVSSVNTGLTLYSANEIANGRTESYPSALDAVATNGTSSMSVPFFGTVIKGGVTSDGWTKKSDTCYEFDLGSSVEKFQYDTSGGLFTLVSSCS